jgi:predicted dehydrogenase
MSEHKLRAAVVGVGHLGRLHAQKWACLERCELVAVCDVEDARCAEVARELQVQALADYRELATRVNAVSIVVPTRLHHEVAAFFLERGVHVLLEKPMAAHLAEAEDLVRRAARGRAVLQIGHLERFNPAIMALDGVIEQPQFVESHRIAPFTRRGADVNVVLDLMIHDIDIIQELVGERIQDIRTLGVPVLTAAEDIANARIEFVNGCVANVTASRVGNKTERKMRIFQREAYISVDFFAKTVAIYRRCGGASTDEPPSIEVDRRVLGGGDALRSEIQDFIASITWGTPPRVSGEDGARALETALLISAKLRERRL